MIAVQNNAIRINHIKVRIDKIQDSKYWLSSDRYETINHIISSKLAQKEYKT